MSPELRNPKLNTAECVIQGHEPNIDAAGMSPYTRPILWCSFFSVLLLGPIIAFLVLNFLGNEPGQEEYVRCAKISKEERKKEKYLICNRKLITYRRENAKIFSAKFLCNFLLPTEIVAICVVIFCLANSVPKDIYVIPVIVVEGFVICIVQCCAKCDFCKEAKKISIYRRSSFIACSNLILYHFCWLIIGIMINPPWGLTVLLIVCFVGFAAFYSVDAIRDAEDTIHRCLIFPAAFIGLCLTVALTVLAGQSFYGRETADDVIKTVLLFAVGKISWMYIGKIGLLLIKINLLLNKISLTRLAKSTQMKTPRKNLKNQLSWTKSRIQGMRGMMQRILGVMLKGNRKENWYVSKYIDT